MTLMLASLREDLAVLAADTAISTVIEGVTYRVTDYYKKLHVINGTLVFLSGDVNLSEWTLRKYKRSRLKGVEELQRIMREEYERYATVRPDFKDREDCVGLFGFFCEMEDGRPVGYRINSASDFKVERCTAPVNAFITVTAGVNEAQAQAVLSEAYSAGIGAVEAYAHVFDTLASEKIGGQADVYLMDRNGIRIVTSHAIKEPKLNRVDRYYLRELEALDRRIESLMLDAVITGSHINVGDGVFTVDGDTGHMRTTSGEFTGSITASDISGGTVTGTRIRTGGDGIYPRVEIDPSTIAFGVYSSPNDGILIPAYDGGVSKIRFLSGGNESVLYNSPATGLVVSAYGNATLAGTNVDLQPTGGHVRLRSWSELRNTQTGVTLQGEIDALWAALSMKANENHSHYVSLPDHNHGNPQNQNSGGGTYAVY